MCPTCLFASIAAASLSAASALFAYHRGYSQGWAVGHRAGYLGLWLQLLRAEQQQSAP